MNRDETLGVTVDETVFRSGDGRFAVVRATQEGGHAPLVLVGDLAAVQRNESLRVRGHFEEHPTHGTRFRVATYLPILPSTAEGLARFLGSVNGVGPSIGKRIVDRFGTQTLDIVTRESARLREVSGIGKMRAERIATAVRAARDRAEQMSFLHSVGLGPALAKRVLEKYGDRAIHQLKDDPYLVAEQVSGIGFRTADTIGRSAGIPDDDPRRAAGAVLHVVGRGADEGHAFLPAEQVLTKASELGVPRPRSAQAIDDLALRGLVVTEAEAVYAPPLFRAEVAVADAVRRLASYRPTLSPKEPGASSSLSSGQLHAVTATLENGLTVITGGPGTGKTTTVRAVVEAHHAHERRVLLCAPTGRAAKRLSEATGAEARTIHRTLEWNPGTGRFLRGPDHPLDSELVLVDEASMLDLRLGESLLGAVGPAASLVLVGDVDQLPPVGAGPVLREILQANVGAVERLSHVFRQAQESSIVQGAHAILHGESPTPTAPGTKGSGDLFVLPTQDADDSHQRLVKVLERMRHAYGLDPKRDVQVLSPMRKGPLGTDRLNLLLQDVLNGAGERLGRFRRGDRVMQLRNDYEKDVFNGDMGVVRRVEGGVTFVSFDGRDVQYLEKDLDSLTLAYATTVHKVQGSEFPAVIIVLHGGHHVMLSRALLYTAVTRAKSLVVILGDPRALRRAVQNAEVYRGFSRLGDRISEQ